MHHEIRKDRRSPGDWRVEAIDPDHGEVVYVTIFTEPDAQERAEEYAAWKNSCVGACLV